MRAVLLLAVGCLVAWPRLAEALPAFARRFNLACGACHTAVPRLNAYGEAFREHGFKLPGTATVTVPARPRQWAEHGLAVWTRGEVYEYSRFGRGPGRRGGFDAPELTSLYMAGALGPWFGLLVEGNLALNRTQWNETRGDWTRRPAAAVEKAYAIIDLPLLLGGHAAPGDDETGNGPTVMLGRIDPSTNFPYPTDRQLFHAVPADTARHGRRQGFDGAPVVRYPLEPYAFGTKYFGLSQRGRRAVLPTESSLYNVESAPGIDVHGRLFASRLRYQFGTTTGVHPAFLDPFYTIAPYGMLRFDFGDGGPTNGSVGAFVNYGHRAYQLPGTTLDVWRTGIGWNLRRERWDLYGAYTNDWLTGGRSRAAGSTTASLDRSAQAVTTEVDYRWTHTLLPSLRFDWMDAGGLANATTNFRGPRAAAVLHLQLRWYLFEGDNLARIPIPALFALSLRDSVNLMPGGAHPFGNWRNGVFVGFDFAF